MKNFLTYLVVCFCILTAVASCKKSGVAPKKPTDSTGTKTGTTTGTTDVYVASAESPDPNTSEKACYWKNGTKVSLPSGIYGSVALQILVSGTDVYVAGYYSGTHACWKNGKLIGLQSTDSARATCLAFANGNLYLGIYTEAKLTASPTIAEYVTISTSLSQSSINGLPDQQNHPTVNSIVVSGSKVYSAGTGRNNIHNEGYVTVPTYWVNSNVQYLTIPSELNVGANFGEASSIAVSGSDIYVAGSVGFANGTNVGTPVVWKNNQATLLAKTSANSWMGGYTGSMFISGSDVYISGTVYNGSGMNPVYWKNGAMKYLPQNAGDAVATSVVVSSTDVYVAGNDGVDILTACYWKNGTKVNLTDGIKSAQANSIFCG
jgi:hypothetical protein